jgi:hypothetical protein
MSTSTYLDLISHAYQEIGVTPGVGGIPDDQAQFMLDRLTMLVDTLNIDPLFIPWYQQQVFNLAPNQQSYLIGPNAPDWDAPRPIRLTPDASNVLLSQSIPVVRLPLAVLSVQQWANIPIQQLAITFPQGCYLDRSVVVGDVGKDGVNPYTASRIWVWGIPTSVNQVEFFYWQQLTVGNLTDDCNLPPGYFRALMLNLAVEAAPAFTQTPSAITLKNAADAMGAVKRLNSPDVSMMPDPGVPGLSKVGWISKAQFLSGVWPS